MKSFDLDNKKSWDWVNLSIYYSRTILFYLKILEMATTVCLTSLVDNGKINYKVTPLYNHKQVAIITTYLTMSN